MGTRNLTCVYLDGMYPVAQYCQWDGYPDGQGHTVFEFIKEMNLIPEGVESFKEKLRKCVWITDEEIKGIWKSCGADLTSTLVNSETAAKFKIQNPYLSRDTGAEILFHVFRSDNGLKLRNSLDFAGESLFCEWAYVIDLDNKKLEVFKGFNKEPLNESERFYGFKIDERPSRDGSVYQPVKLVAAFNLNNMPNYEDFLRACILEDDEDSEFITEQLSTTNH